MIIYCLMRGVIIAATCKANEKNKNDNYFIVNTKDTPGLASQCFLGWVPNIHFLLLLLWLNKFVIYLLVVYWVSLLSGLH